MSPAVEAQSLNHWTSREVAMYSVLLKNKLLFADHFYLFYSLVGLKDLSNSPLDFFHFISFDAMIVMLYY